MSEDIVEKVSFAFMVLCIFIFYISAFIGYLNRDDIFSAMIALGLGFMILFLGMIVHQTERIADCICSKKEVRGDE